MNYTSIFNFLSEDKKFKQIYEECIDFESTILNSLVTNSLRSARTISQLLINKIGYPNSEVRKLFKEAKKKGYSQPEYSKVLKKCSRLKLIDKDTKEKYYFIKKYGDATSHGDDYGEYDLSDCKKVHEQLFYIALDCFKRFHDDDLKFDYLDELEYKYNLDDVENIKSTSKQRNNLLNNVYYEINKQNFKDYLKLNKIYLYNQFCDSIIEEYENHLIYKNDLNNFFEKNSVLTEDNLSELLSFFDISIKRKLLEDLKDKNKKIIDNLEVYLNEIQDDFTFDDISLRIDESEDADKQYYQLIKDLSFNFLKDDLEVMASELNNNPISVKDKFGREIQKFANYEVVRDDYGLKIEEVEKNIFLDEDQEAAVKYSGEKPLVINAGPGSGKTRVLIERVKFLIKNGVEPDTILVITFTNEATNELRNRLKYETNLGLNVVNKIKISTVHGFCRYLIAEYEKVPYNYLERFGEKGLFFNKYKGQLGFTGYSHVPDYEFASTIEKKYDLYFNFGLLSDEFYDYMKNYIDSTRKITSSFMKYIDEFKLKNNGRFPTFNQINDAGHINAYYYAKYIKIIESYPKYKKLLEDKKSCDDNYLLEKAYDILCNVVTPFKNILIDEYQDTDFHLKKIFDKLQENAKTFTIVGDSDQSIYGWRGALPHYFDDIIDVNNRENIEYIELHTNYRSTSDLVDFNEEFIRNRRKVKKNLRAKKQYEAPVYHLESNELNEFSDIIYVIKSLFNDHKIKKYGDIAVLFRTNNQANRFINSLKENNLDYYLKGNKDLLERDEIKSILMLFWLLMPYDKYSLVYRGKEFLNLSGFHDSFSKDFFKLSNKTTNILSRIQREFENNVRKTAYKKHNEEHSTKENFSYEKVFTKESDFIKKVIDEVNPINILDLDENELKSLGITDNHDLNFFKTLKNLRNIMFGENNISKPSTLEIFNELIHINDYIDEISFRNSLDSIKIEKNLAMVSRIIKDYENIRGYRDYINLFNYLNGVLAAYSSYIDESETFDDKIHIMTVHKSKGLEYPVIIIASLNDGAFPKEYKNDYPFPTDLEFLQYKPDDLDSEKKIHYAEEMRMIYVAATRAKEILILSTNSPNHQFLQDMKNESNVEIKKLSKNVNIIPKIKSSKASLSNSFVPELFIEEINRDYLICPYRYYVSNDVKFAVKVSNDKHVEMVLNILLNNIHSQDGLSKEDISNKIKPILEYHDLSSNENDYKVISNVESYWENFGYKYDVVYTNYLVTKELSNCNLNGNIDLIINDHDGFSIVKFIGSNEKIIDKEYYELMLHFYAIALKNTSEFRDKKLDKIILHSLEQNSCDEFTIKEIYENYCLKELNKITSNIINKQFEKKNNCQNCEYYGNLCK